MYAKILSVSQNWQPCPQGHHYAEVSSVFGLDREEFDCLKAAGLKIRPQEFEKNDKSEDRFQVSITIRQFDSQLTITSPTDI